MEFRNVHDKESAAGRWRIAAAVAIAVLYVLVGSSFGPGNQTQTAPAAETTLAQNSR